MRRISFVLLGIAAVAQISCVGSTTKGTTPPPSSPTVTVAPSSANVRVGGNTQPFTATVTGESSNTVTWAVNGVAGGNSTAGTVSSTGVYTAPASLPNPNTITVTATSTADASVSGTAAVTLWNAIPGISSASPSSFTAGSFTLTVKGSNFVSGSRVLFAGAALATTFVSSTQLTATGTEATAGTYAVSVNNPNPGESTTATINVTVNAQSSGGGGGGGGGGGTPSACSAISTGQGGSLNGFLPFTASNLWNKNVASDPVDSNSTAILNFIGTSAAIHADFGSGTYQGSSIGIPYVVVDGSQALVPVTFTAYGDESDPGPFAIPGNAPIEGYPNPGDGDRHVLVINTSNCFLYEMDNSQAQTNGSWDADSAALWDLTTDEQRPLTWTSADAAGLPIFAGLVRYDEVASGEIKHAIRFTLQHSKAAFVAPASHWASNSSNANAAPMGMRMRLKASFNISSYSATNQVILKAMQQYGVIMADNGSNMYISGTPDSRWDNDDLHNLGNVTAANFEVVQMGTVYTQANVPSGASPVISGFTASASSVSAGTPVTLSWSVTGESYLIVTPQLGPVRGTSISVTPTATTTYTLVATNEYGRTTQQVTVNVQ